MFFSSKDDDSVEFIDLEKVREGWLETEPEQSVDTAVVAPAQPPQIQWETEVVQRFEQLRQGLCDYLPGYIETFDVLFESLQEDLNRWLGIKDRRLDEQDIDPDIDSDIDSDEADVLEPTQDEAPPVEESVMDAEEAGLAFEKGLMELENFVEAIFVDGDFWRLMR